VTVLDIEGIELKSETRAGHKFGAVFGHHSREVRHFADELVKSLQVKQMERWTMEERKEGKRRNIHCVLFDEVK